MAIPLFPLMYFLAVISPIRKNGLFVSIISLLNKNKSFLFEEDEWLKWKSINDKKKRYSHNVTVLNKAVKIRNAFWFNHTMHQNLFVYNYILFSILFNLKAQNGIILCHVLRWGGECYCCKLSLNNSYVQLRELPKKNLRRKLMIFDYGDK